MSRQLQDPAPLPGKEPRTLPTGWTPASWCGERIMSCPVPTGTRHSYRLVTVPTELSWPPSVAVYTNVKLSHGIVWLREVGSSILLECPTLVCVVVGFAVPTISHVFRHLAVPCQGSCRPYQSTLRNTPEDQRSDADGLCMYLSTEWCVFRVGDACVCLAVCRATDCVSLSDCQVVPVLPSDTTTWPVCETLRLAGNTLRHFGIDL